MTERTISTIERDLAGKRADLDADLSHLRDKLQPEALMARGKEELANHAVPLAATAGAAVTGAVKTHPVALALLGAGAAWLLWANRKKDDVPPADNSALAGTKFEAISRWEDEGGPLPPEPVEEEADPAADDGWMAEADSLRDKARGLLSQLDKAARDKLMPAAEIAKERSAVLAALTSDVRGTMSKGLEGLGEQAKAAALTAREAAYTARITAGDMAQKGVTLAKENPLIVAALIGAAGVAVAAALPRNKRESGQVGAWRDKLFAAATAFAAGEIEKQIAQFTAGLETARDKAKEAGETPAAKPVAQEGKVSRL